jgi:GntR family transcriptional regulator
LKALQPGDQLPPEPALAQQLGVSRPTLREVLRSFAERGLLIRRRGVGTFVTSRLPILETGLEVLESLERMAQRLGLATEMALLSITERMATDAELDGLERKEAAQVLVVDRVIAIEGEPVADLRDVVPIQYLDEEGLSEGFRGSVLDVLLELGTPTLTSSRTQIMAVSADAGEACRLKIEPGTALLRLVAQLFSYDEQIVDYSVSTFVPGHFKFQVIRQVRT